MTHSPSFTASSDLEGVPDVERAELLEDFREKRIYDAAAPEPSTQSLAAYPDALGVVTTDVVDK